MMSWLSVSVNNNSRPQFEENFKCLKIRNELDLLASIIETNTVPSSVLSKNKI